MRIWQRAISVTWGCVPCITHDTFSLKRRLGSDMLQTDKMAHGLNSRDMTVQMYMPCFGAFQDASVGSLQRG